MMRLSGLLLVLMVFPAPLLAQAQSLLLTGEVSSSQAQSLTVPRAGRAWRYQIQWMAPEGEMVRAGDPVVVFDKSGVSGQIDQFQAALIRVDAAVQAKQVELKQQRLQAEFEVTEKRLLREKAQLDAEVPADFQSPKEYADKQFELMKAGAELAKSKRALAEVERASLEEMRKLTIDRDKAQLELSNAEQLMTNLELTANHDGPMIYARQPWDGAKTEVGDTVQVGTQVATIPGVDGLQVQAWANEVDIDRVKVGMDAQLTLDARQDRQLSGTVTKVALKAERRNGWGESNWFLVNVALNQGESVTLVPGMSVLVALEVSQ
ncbi:HlyD family secretion protein [Ferrimonas sp. SCSIO 43195]|uniref:HlyD family secretion protein n=1 Tax=Ferrimonas sp. SCSIO 43195 TaxID=2822844 RepID=UPI00207500EF|nr:HlyD family efflux transporter periplasmic adaptor subunit [Ferrimonas sp. SCSIO 43195]USD36015.1 HlyD family efflux transporter periplasmic adaptor subunit [Ferrimonas sp. SCSIO 43195]